MRKHSLWILLAATLLSFAGCGPKEVGMIAVYQVDAGNAAPAAKLSGEKMKKLVAAIDRHVNSGRSPGGSVRELDNGRIEVSIFRADPDAMQRVADLLPRSGTLEFRILANVRDHKAEIVLAQQSKARRVVDAQGELVAWWIPVAKGREDSFATYDEIATRVTSHGGKETTEILVIKDVFNVTGEYLSYCTPGIDEFGRPCLNLTFNRRGGQLFGGLTGANLPDETQNFSRKLGIILDGQLYSAPAIRSAIYDRSEITGSFTEQEVEDLANVLNAGTLPVAIRKVDQRLVP